VAAPSWLLLWASNDMRMVVRALRVNLNHLRCRVKVAHFEQL